MATYDMTLKGAGVGADSIAAFPDVRNQAYMVEAVLDIDKLVAAGRFSGAATGDIFQLLEIPAGSFVISAGAQVLKAFNGTTPVADIDFAGGDDIVDGGDLATLGYLAAGVNGGANTTAQTTFTQLVTTADTIDVTLTVTGSVTEGKLRVYAVLVDLNSVAASADEVDRDQLA